MFLTYILAFSLVWNLCSAQDGYFIPELQHQYHGLPAHQYFQGDGLFHSSLDNANRRSFQATPQFTMQVVTLPDGSMKAVPVPQG